jgi:hypothetical protein
MSEWDGTAQMILQALAPLTGREIPAVRPLGQAVVV